VIALADVALDIGGRRLLDNIDARVDAGEMLAVLGPNGAGKTTLLRAIAGLHPAARGSIAIDGDAVSNLSSVARALRVALVTSDEVLLDALYVRDVVSIGRFPHHRWWEWQRRRDDDRAVEAALAAVALEPLADRLFSTLSSGERQRVWIALGLAQETPVLLLDEPTSHLDARVAHEILALLRALANGGKTVVCVLHDLNDAAAYAHRIALIAGGKMLGAGAPDDVLASDLLERTFGIAMERVRLEDGRLRVFAATLGSSGT
jgi:iron complex transport system ATP-binding protein